MDTSPTPAALQATYYNECMETRSFSLLDRVIGEIDKAIKVLTAPAQARRPAPSMPEAAVVAGAPGATPNAGAAAIVPLPVASGGRRRAEAELLRSARLMRVNHAGEVAAQALYRGQAFTARKQATRDMLLAAGEEENDHLAWCAQRLEELQGRHSMLNPLWYAGSFALGAAAGLLGDGLSLGFLAETERQVEAHLRGHLKDLWPLDQRSRAIIEQMTHDEVAHGEHASALGGHSLPFPARWAMRATSKVMTNSSYWL